MQEIFCGLYCCKGFTLIGISLKDNEIALGKWLGDVDSHLAGVELLADLAAAEGRAFEHERFLHVDRSWEAREMLSDGVSEAVLDGAWVELRKQSFVVDLYLLADEILGRLAKEQGDGLVVLEGEG